jgi:hypothetical protein
MIPLCWCGQPLEVTHAHYDIQVATVGAPYVAPAPQPCPTPYQLWKQSGEDMAKYKDLLVEHGLATRKPSAPQSIPVGVLMSAEQPSPLAPERLISAQPIPSPATPDAPMVSSESAVLPEGPCVECGKPRLDWCHANAAYHPNRHHFNAGTPAAPELGAGDAVRCSCGLDRDDAIHAICLRAEVATLRYQLATLNTLSIHAGVSAAETIDALTSEVAGQRERLGAIEAAVAVNPANADDDGYCPRCNRMCISEEDDVDPNTVCHNCLYEMIDAVRAALSNTGAGAK